MHAMMTIKLRMHYDLQFSNCSSVDFPKRFCKRAISAFIHANLEEIITIKNFQGLGSDFFRYKEKADAVLWVANTTLRKVFKTNKPVRNDERILAHEAILIDVTAQFHW